MPHSRVWGESLSRLYHSQKADAFISRAQAYYDEYCALHSTEPSRGHRTVLKTRVLPGLFALALAIFGVMILASPERRPSRAALAGSPPPSPTI